MCYCLCQTNIFAAESKCCTFIRNYQDRSGCFLKFYLSCQQQQYCCQCCSVCVSLLLPALATVMRMTRKKPKVHTPATGSTTVVSMPETKRSTLNVLFPMKPTGCGVTEKQELTVLRSVGHFDPDGTVRQEAQSGVCSHCFSLSD